jgi:hypothetical protein
MDSNTANDECRISFPGHFASNDPAARSLEGHYGHSASDQRHAIPNHLADYDGLARANSAPHQWTGNVQQSASVDLQQAYDNAEAHVADQEDSSGLPVLLTNEDLVKRLGNLKSAADKNSIAVFKIMWNSVNRDVSNAELAVLPSQ